MDTTFLEQTELVEEVLEKENEHPELQQLLLVVSFYNERADFESISRAYHFAELAHRGQFRESGCPYIIHSIEVARILSNLHLDSTTIAAGLLHDIVEDTGITHQQVSAEFGEEIATLVDGVTKITEWDAHSVREPAKVSESLSQEDSISQAQSSKSRTEKTQEIIQAENLRKMLLSMVKDIRVILIKFADRLNNMRTLESLSPDQQKRIALETREVYAPLAHRMGIARIKWELEDLSIKYLDFEAYQSIREKIALKRDKRERYIEEIKVPLQKELKANKIEAEITGRPKSFYSIYSKMKKRGLPFEDIYDLFAIRIIVETVKECYHVLGLLHSMYTPVTARFKDFIATPKSNMYQSLHTTVIGPSGEMVEIQIRTKNMHQTAEEGIASHWRYKEGLTKEDELDKHMVWLRQLVEWQQDTESKDFMEELKIDLFQDEIFVFTPKGALKRLPRGATPLDFAFSVHTDVGLHSLGAKVNGKMSSLGTELKSGDTVQIITSLKQEPHTNWLEIVKTSKARSSIKHWLKETRYTHSVELGKKMLEREFKRLRIKINQDELLDIAQSCGEQDIDHLFANVGNGQITTGRITSKIMSEPSQKGMKRSDIPGMTGKTLQGPKRVSEELFDKKVKGKGIRIEGLDNMMIQFAKCCNPVPGDGIVGLITRGRGVSIHRVDCPNSLAMLQAADDDPASERIVPAEWDTQKGQSFIVPILVQAVDRKNLLRDITRVFAETRTNIRSGSLGTKEDISYNNFELDVRNLQHLSGLIKKLSKIDDVIDVKRLDEPEALDS